MIVHMFLYNKEREFRSYIQYMTLNLNYIIKNIIFVFSNPAPPLHVFLKCIENSQLNSQLHMAAKQTVSQ